MRPLPLCVYGFSPGGLKSLQLPTTQFVKIQSTAACIKPKDQKEIHGQNHFLILQTHLSTGKRVQEFTRQYPKSNHTGVLSVMTQMNLQNLDCDLRSSVLLSGQPPETAMMIRLAPGPPRKSHPAHFRSSLGFRPKSTANKVVLAVARPLGINGHQFPSRT